MKKSSLFISLILIMILAISAVSAADDVTSDVGETQAVDEVSTPVDEPVVTGDAGVLKSSPDSEVLTAPGDKNFTQLQQEIDDSPYGMINLGSNYVRQEGENDIVISKSFNIFGNDQYTIDANGLGGIFKVNEGVTLLLNNVILANGNANNGGAIYNEGTVAIISSQISDSKATDGGAIYNKGILSISGSTLDGNTATTKGGAIYSEGTVVVDGSTFDNNKVTTGSTYAETQADKCNGGAAIYNEGDLTVTKSTFTKNTAPHAQEVFSAGGAIYNKDAGTLLVDDCKFEENSAVYGGAIMFEKFSQDTVAIKNSVFNNNEAWQGGAINGNDFVGSLIVTGSNFTGNKAVEPNAGQSQPCGGAFMIGTKSYTGVALDVSDCNFEDNDGGYMGGAISSSPNNNIKVANSNFTNNVAAILGGAIVTGTGTTLSVSESTFTGNKATNAQYGMGGAIFAEPNSQSTITDSTFTGNVDIYPVAIMNYQGSLELSGNTFDDNSVFNYGTITSPVKVTVLDNETVTTTDGNVDLYATVTDDNDNFIRDTSFNFEIDGEQIEATYDASNKRYTATYALSTPGIYTVTAVSAKGEEYTVKNGAVKNYRGTFTDLNSKIEAAIAAGTDLELGYNFTYTPDFDDDEGMADGIKIYGESLTINGNGYTIDANYNNRGPILETDNYASVILNNITFINSDYGAITNYAELTVNDCIFKDNNVDDSCGAAIYSTVELKVNRCTFENNTCGVQGAAIYNSGELTVTDSVFKNNKVTAGTGYAPGESTNGGAAIYSDTGSTLTITGSNFTNNTAPHDAGVFSAGGAIYVYNATNVLIEDCRFEENSAVYGGAIIFEKFNQSTVAVKDSVFNNNQAWQGGAINGNELVGSLIITGSNFTANKAVEPNVGQSSPTGGALMIGTKSTDGVALDVSECNFVENDGGYMGGAIASSPNNVIDIKDSNFTNNVATTLGGAIVTGTGTKLTVDGSTFTGNKVNSMGGAIFVEPAADVTVSDSTFTSNVDAYPAAIMSYQGTLSLSNNIFDDASVFNYGGEITSEIKVTVLNNETVTVSSEDVTLTANITDDNGNVIRDSTFKFVINGEQVVAAYNEATKLHQGTYTLPGLGLYPVTVISTKDEDVTVKTGAIQNIKGTYTDLQAKIDTANGELVLPYNFTYNEAIDGANFPTGVVINTPITINGNGYTISGNDKYRIFTINNDTTLKNITFTNGNAKIFSPMAVTGGAIYVNRDIDYVSIEDCVFDNNKAMSSGGAIYSMSKINVVRSNFTDNTGMNAGAIHIFSGLTSTIADSNFIGNNATGTGTTGRGGAIFANAAVSISGSNFTDNYGKVKAGAIFFDTAATGSSVENSNFNSNEAKQSGAIETNAKISISKSNFTDNEADINGAITISSVSTESSEVSDCNFIGVDDEGYSIVNVGKLTLTGNNISGDVNNKVGTSLSLDSNVVNGIINNQGTILTPVNAIVLNNKTVETAEDTYVLNATLTDDNNNIIYDPNLKFKVNDDEAVSFTSYENGVYTYDAYAIGFEPKYVVNVTSTGEEKLNVKTGTIKNLKAGTYTDLAAKIADAIANHDGVLDLPYDFEYTEAIDGTNFPNGIVITDALTINGNGYTISGNNSYKVFDVTAGTLTLNNLTVANGISTEPADSNKFGGAIHVSQGAALVAENVTFINNTAAGQGGAIFSWGDVTIKEGTKFINNTAETGGAIFVIQADTLDITGATFADNTATSVAGAVYANAGTVTIKDSSFNNNTAELDSGAVKLVSTQATITSSNFTANKANTLQGGAVYVGQTSSLTVDDCKFENNTALNANDGDGAAIYSGFAGPLVVKDSEFINNTAGATGGAISSKYTETEITGSKFEDNKAATAGALYFIEYGGRGGATSVKDSEFISNEASGNGGAIFFYDGDDNGLTIDNTNFTDNKAGNTGGAILLAIGHADITANFTGNDADVNGSAVYIREYASADIEDSTFADNGAADDYAIYNLGTLGLARNTMDNTIYSDGTITSTTNVTVLGNKTVNAKYGQTVILNATYTDDNGNSIYDPNLAFTVEGDEDLIPATYADGLYTAEYKISMMGEKAVTARLPYDVDTYNGLLDIGPATVILTIDANETIMRKQNETITIKLSDEFGNLLNLSLPVVVQNSAEEDVFSQIITTQNGTYTFNLTGLGVDTYTITAVFSNDNYVPNPKLVFKPFEVTPLEINGTYTDLQKQIDETLENGVLVLPYDFAYDDFVDEDFFPYGVIINKNITIDGNGSTISGSNVYRIFNITSGNVVFNNITFVDGIADNGGAIYVNSTEDITVTISNSTFANNTATIGGGAVAFMSDDDSKVTYYIIDSLFENNTATGTFKEDESVAGGAVYSEGITDWCYIGFTTFKNNKAIEGNMPNGGAVKVQFGGKLVVLNSTFEDNFAEQAGGAISIQSNTNMNCSVMVLNTKFENNKAGQAGAAVSAIETSGNSLVGIINSTFENNVADITAHAIYVSPRSSVVVVNTTLTDNGGITDYGIYNLGKLALMNNTISNIVYTNSVYGEGVITTDTYARILENQTIDITSDRYTLVTTLTDDNGNKIYDRNLEFTINGVPIDAVPAYDKESGLYTYVFEIGSERIYVVNVTSDNEKKLNTEVGILRFINGTYTDLLNKINDAEGTLVLPYNFTYTAEIDGDKFPSGVVINKSITIDGNGSTISGNNSYRIFYIASSNVNLTNITFTKGNASGKWGGAIYVNGAYENLTVSDSKFIQNNAGVNGGAIYWAGDKGKLLSSSFMNNTAGASGGAVFWFGDDGYIGNGSSFMMNNATENGGAVAWFTNGAVGGHNGVIDNSTFMMNSAGQNGGAVFWQSPDGTLKNSRFMFRNSATQNGGAVFWFAENGVIDNSSFMMNSIKGDLGGALFSQGENLTIKDSSFMMNFAANGGAVALLAKATIDNSTFTFLNSAKNYGGAIYIDSDVSISNSTIAYNNATIGKGIYVNSGKLSLQNNTINNASADIVLSSNAVIVSYVNATILGNTTVDTTGLTVNLTANITDDRGNLIEAPNFKFVINGEEVAAAYNATSKLYEAEYTLPGVGVYPVDMTYTETENLDTYIGIIRNVKGTYTDLQNLINDADGELILPYDFIYTKEIDGEKFPEGVLIESPIVIEGNGYTISGNNSYRIFRITAETTINNVTFTNGSAVEFGGAIYTTADLTVSNSTFVNNSVALNDANGGAIAAIADGSEITLNVNNVLFENNCVDNAGGAIAVATMDSKVNYNIYDSEFVDNYAYEAIAASGGAIFSYGNTEGLINNTVFRRNYIDCEDLSNGGAIKLQFGGKLTVANSTFEDNEAEYTGSAISVQADDGKNNVLVVDNCTFTGNSASYGDTITSKQYAGESVVIIKGSTFDSGIFLDGLTKASISNSTIENEGYHGIYNLGLLILDKNVVDIIYNNGTILSSVNATLLGNETVPAELYDEVYPFATLTDDNENPIYDPNFRITVNDVVIEDVEYDYDENIYVSNYTIEKPGDYVVSTLYAADIYTGIYQVPKANITRFEVIPGGQDNRIPYGENVTVYVVLEGVDGEGLNETFNVIVNNAEYSVTVTNGSGSFNVSGLAPGQYAALGIFPGNDCYNKAYATGVFSVLEPEAKLTIEIEDITVGDYLIVKVNFTDADGNPIYGAIEVIISNGTYSESYGVITYGNNTISISDLPVGKYNATAVFVGDEKYGAVNNNTTFEVKQITDYDMTVIPPTEVPYGQTVKIEVELPEDATGNVTVTINDTPYTATVEDGSATIEIDGLEVGDYTDLEVIYSGDENYVGRSETVDVYVGRADSGLDAWFDEAFISYRENSTIIISIDEGATGTIAIYYDDGDVLLGNFTVEEALDGIEVTNLTAGDHWFYVVYSGDDHFEDTTCYDVGITVEKIDPELDIDATGNKTVGSEITITFTTPEDVDGVVSILVDGEPVPFTGENGTYTVTLNNLSAGNHVVMGVLEEDTNYNDYSVGGILEISKADPTIGISVDPSEVVTGGSVTVTVTIDEDATGYVLADVNGMSFFGIPEDGTFTFDIDGLEAMTYDIVVTYVGDDKYSNGTATASFTVGKAASSVEIISVANATYPDDVIVIFEVVNATDITVVISKDGAPVEAIVVVSEEIDTVAICGLATGVYTINITNVGDDNYDGSSATALFNVSQATPVISVSAADVTYPGDVVVTVTSDASGTVTVTVGDKTVADTVEANIAKDFIISGLDANEEGYAITVGLAESENYTAGVNDTEKVKVMKAASSVVIDDIVDVTYNASVEVTYTVENETEISVVVKDANGTEITTGVNTTTAGKVIISGLNAGEYTIAISNAASDNYAESSDVAKFNVNKAVITIDPEATGDMLVDSEINVTFTVPKDIDGMLDVTIDGNPVLAFIVINGTCTIPGTYEAGLHTVVVTLTGDTNYEDAIGQTTFNVTKVDPTIGISVDPSEVVPGGSVTVTVTIDEDATGYVLADVNGMSFFGIPEDGTFTFDIDDLQAIEHEIDVTYVGDDKYNKGTSSYNFTVRKATSDIEANLPGEAYVGDFVVVEVTVDPAAATGNYSVFIDGVDVSEQFGDLNITNGKGSFVITALTNGTHTIGVRYNGDNNYNASEIVEYTIEVSKVDVSEDIEIEGSVIAYGENATVILSGLPEDATGTVTVTIGDDSYTADVEDGIAIVEIPGLDAGLYESLLVEYSGDNKYEDAKGMATIEVTPAFIDWGLADIPEEIEVNDTVTIVLDWTDPEDASGKLNITLNDEYYGEYTFDEARDGIIINKFTKPGEYTIVVSAVDDPNYEYAEPLEMVVVVDTIDAEMEVTVPEDAKVDEVVNVDVTLPEDATGDVTVIVDGKEVDTVPLVDGAVSIPVEGLAVGNHTVVVIYSGDDQYSPVVSDNINLTVSKVDPTIIIKVDNITVGDNATVTVTVPDDATGYVLIEVGGKQQFAEINDGKATITVSDLPAGNYTVTAILTSDDKYSEGRNTTSLKVDKVEEYDVEINSTSPREGDNATVTVTVPEDATGNVTVTDKDGNNYTAPVKDGTATVEVPNLPEGDNEVTVTYSGDDKYGGKTTNANITVRSAIRSTTLYADVLVKYEGEAAKYNVTLIDEDGFAVEGMPINMTIIGKTYHGTTDANGVAYLPINLKPGIYSITAEFGGQGNYTAAEPLTTEVHVLTKVRLDQNKDLVKDYGDADKFTVRALDEYGKPIAGEVVNITIVGKTYHAKTNADGIASLAINLRPGTYDITCDYAGYSVSNTVTVKQVLSAPDKQYKKASSYSYTATLKHTNGQAISGKTVTFTLKGQTYTATTNAKGEATISITQALSAGSYKIAVKYIDSTITKTITIK